MKICKDITETIEQKFQQPVDHVIKQVDEVCEDLPWPLDWICHAVTTIIKWTEYILVVIVKSVTRTVCEIVSFVSNAVGWIINLVLALPIIGAVVRWIIGAIVWVISQIIHVVDFVLGLLGIKPIKHLRLEVIILRDPDSGPLMTEAELGAALDFAAQTYRDRARIKLHSNVQTVTNPTPRVALTVDSEIGMYGEDATRTGSYFQLTANQMLFDSAFSRAIRFFDPIVCFVVRGLGTESTFGGSMGPTVDYICVEAGVVGAPRPSPEYDQTTLPHEMGHALGLLHDARFLSAKVRVTSTTSCFGARPHIQSRPLREGRTSVPFRYRSSAAVRIVPTSDHARHSVQPVPEFLVWQRSGERDSTTSRKRSPKKARPLGTTPRRRHLGLWHPSRVRVQNGSISV